MALESSSPRTPTASHCGSASGTTSSKLLENKFEMLLWKNILEPNSSGSSPRKWLTTSTRARSGTITTSSRRVALGRKNSGRSPSRTWELWMRMVSKKFLPNNHQRQNLKHHNLELPIETWRSTMTSTRPSTWMVSPLELIDLRLETSLWRRIPPASATTALEHHLWHPSPQTSTRQTRADGHLSEWMKVVKTE